MGDEQKTVLLNHGRVIFGYESTNILLDNVFVRTPRLRLFRCEITYMLTHISQCHCHQYGPHISHVRATDSAILKSNDLDYYSTRMLYALLSVAVYRVWFH